MPPVYIISKSFEFYLQKISWIRLFFTTSTATTLMQTNTVSHLDSYYRNQVVWVLPCPLPLSSCFQHSRHSDTVKIKLRSFLSQNLPISTHHIQRNYCYSSHTIKWDLNNAYFIVLLWGLKESICTKHLELILIQCSLLSSTAPHTSYVLIHYVLTHQFS